MSVYIWAPPTKTDMTQHKCDLPHNYGHYLETIIQCIECLQCYILKYNQGFEDVSSSVSWKKISSKKAIKIVTKEEYHFLQPGGKRIIDTGPRIK